MLKEGFKDEIISNAYIKLDWMDRIRALFGGTIHLHLRTWAENVPGKLETGEVRVYVDRIIPRKPRPMQGQIEIGDTAND